MKGRLLLVPILLSVVGCAVGGAADGGQGARTTATTSVVPPAVVRVGKTEACARVHATLDRLELPLQLLADGGTPVSWSEDFVDAAQTFHKVGREGPGTVASFAEGLGGDLDRLVTALDSGTTGAVPAIGDVVTNRIRNLKNACK